MYSGWYPPPQEPCPNCGLTGKRGKNDDARECSSCGYTYPPPAGAVLVSSLFFCSKCGCTYLDACPNPDHPKAKT